MGMGSADWVQGRWGGEQLPNKVGTDVRAWVLGFSGVNFAGALGSGR